ncbi:Spy/CpxP family protein refolding chaperone [Billgrantia sp. Q4P2]|uniref:Spy/CpxP family protein refolding chaperone n=1 Tax=Billgrantia sp. Q4P2 TaxID=3463857 RepID=UPI004057B42E
MKTKLACVLGFALLVGVAGNALTQERMDEASGMMGGGMGGGMMGGGMMGGGMMGGGMMGGGMGPGMMPCPMMSGEAKSLLPMLDQEQRSELRELIHEHRPTQFERMGQIMNLRDDLMAAMHAERPDPEEVQALHAQMAELHGEMMAEMVRLRNAMHDLMTEEQRQQLQQAMPDTTVAPEDHEAHH